MVRSSGTRGGRWETMGEVGVLCERHENPQTATPSLFSN